jgi:hypothetical protein
MKKLVPLLALIALGFVTLAPTYIGPGNATPLVPGTCVNLLFNEQPATGSFSQQISILTSVNQPTANISFEFRFAGNPGTFNEQIEDADTDATGNYVTLPVAGTVTSCPITPGGSYTCRVELNPFRGQFARIYTQTQNSNSVNLTVLACR